MVHRFRQKVCDSYFLSIILPWYASCSDVSAYLQWRRQLTLCLLSSLSDSLQSHVVFCQIHAGLKRWNMNPEYAYWASLISNTDLNYLPTSLLNSLTMCLRRCWSKSSPPRKVSPLVDFTSKTPFWISRIEISNVPPPRSYTAILQTDISHIAIHSPCAESLFRLSNKNLLHSHFILGFVQTIGQSSSCGLIDHTQDIQTCDLTCIFGSLKSQKYIRCRDVVQIQSSDHSISEIIWIINSLNSMYSDTEDNRLKANWILSVSKCLED